MSEGKARPRRATLTSVAQAAGVSLPTVSKVVNGRGDVAPATRARIEQLLAQHEYVGSSQARPQVGLRCLNLVFDTYLNPYSMEITRGVIEAAAEQEVDVVLGLSKSPVSGATWADRVVRSGREGLILVTTELTAAQRDHFVLARVPLVLIDPINVPDADVVSIGSTNWSGALNAVDHLLQLGHTRIGAIIGNPNAVFGGARLHGYRAALANAGLAFEPDLVRSGPVTFDAARQDSLLMLQRPDRPTAIFATSDVEALGVLEAARELGIRVPDQLSVISFDDTVLARMSAPPLTVISQPFAEMGRVATQMLLQLAAGQRPASHRIELATKLVVRESTAAPSTPTEQIR
jgi:LacI family transcriptional regulator